MIKIRQSTRLSVLVATSIVTFTPVVAQAQPIEAGSTNVITIGNQSFILDGDRSIPNPQTGEINIFHTFSDFSIRSGETAYFFTDNLAVENIIGRVTSNIESNIDGTISHLGADSNFNLFLINPNGIIFGENARIDPNITGSFLATTAENFVFTQGRFGASTGNGDVSLLIDIPVALQFGALPGAISVLNNRGTAPLTYSGGSTFGLIGGSSSSTNLGLQIDGEIASINSQIELGSVLANSFVEIESTASGFNLNYGQVQNYADIDLGQFASIESRGGTLQIYGQDISLAPGAQIVSSPSNLQPSEALDIYAAGVLRLEGTSTLFRETPAEILSISPINSRFGNAPVSIQAERLEILNGSRISHQVYTGSDSSTVAPEIDISATSILVSGVSPSGRINSAIIADSLNGSGAAGGDINLSTQDLMIENGGRVSASTTSEQDGGNITISNLGNSNIGSSSVIIRGFNPLLGADDPSKISVSTFTDNFTEGNAGNIIINTDLVVVQDYAEISADSDLDVLSPDAINLLSQAGAGNILISATNINLERSSRITATTTDSVSDGNIIIRNFDTLRLDNSSDISTSTSNGLAGNIGIYGNQLILANNSEITSSASEAQGTAGHIDVVTERIVVNNSDLSTSAIDEDSGAISIDAIDLISLNSSSSITSKTRNGESGEIFLITDQLNIGDSEVSTSTTHNGQAGAVKINVSGRTGLIDSEITSQALGRRGVAGDVTITTGQLHASGLDLSTSAVNGGGGEIIVNATDNINLVDQSSITSESVDGRSGRIRINGSQLSADDSTISTETVTGQAGSVEINIANQVNLNNSLISSAVDSETSDGSGIAGNIDISTEQFTARGSNITTSAIDENSGAIAIDATDLINLSSGSNITSRIRDGESGEISLVTGQLNASDSAISTSTTQNGQAGIVDIDVLGQTNLRDSEITSQALGRRGVAGNVDLNTGQLHANDSDFSTSAVNGSGGEISINATDSIDLNSGSSVTSETRGGESGQLSFVTRKFNTDNSRVSTSTESGQAGQIDIRVADKANLQNFSVIESRARRADGDAGMINFTAGQLNSERSTLTTTTRNGTAGTISFSISEGTNLVNSQVTSQALDDQGNAGNIDFNTRQFFARNARISTSVIDGDSGAISINATDSIELNNQTAILSTSTGTGQAGRIDFTTQRFSVNNSSADVQATASGNAGALSVTASRIDLNNGSLTASAQTGVGGAVSLQNFRELTLLNDSIISTSATTGQAGDITLQGESAPVTVDQNSQIVSTAGNGGTAGGIEIGLDTQSIGELNIFNGSGISVSAGSANQPGTAGNISIYAALLNMDENASITATTGSGLGGSIDLDVANGIFLRNNSDIRTTAYGAGNGGNMTIVAPNGFILALLDEDSDIVANSISGNGGFISAEALGIYGFRLFEDAETPESDFTANSVFGIDGTVILNTRDNLQPEDLPADVLRDDFLAGCAAIAQQYETGQEQSRFIISGWGGLAATADALLSPDNVTVDLATWIDSDSQDTNESTNISSNPGSTQLFREELLFGSNCQGAEQL